MADGALSLSVLLGVVIGFLLLLCVWQPILDLLRSGVSESGARIPNGTTGWPLIGETLAYSRDPRAFTAAKIKKSGSVFKTSLFGKTVIVGTTPEFAKFVLTNKNRTFESGWPASVTEILGSKSWAFKDGPHHVNVKRVFAKSLQPDGIRQYVGMMEKVALRNMASWVESGFVNASRVGKALTLDVALYLQFGIFDIATTPEGPVLVENLRQMGRAFLSMPLKLPGTEYSKGLKAKDYVTKFLKNRFLQRRGGADTGSDALGLLLATLKDPDAPAELKGMDDDSIVDGLVILMFGSYHTTATTLVWSLKILTDHPDIYRRVKAEQEELRKSKTLSGQPALTWDDLKLMEYSTKFMNEVLRYTSVTQSVYRRTVRDTEFEGHRIPKGWLVALSMATIQHDSGNFPDALTFDPSRFDTPPKPYTNLPFSAGTHICPGIENVRVLFLIFLHHITTTFTFSPTESKEANSEIIFDPFCAPKNGFPMHFSRQPTTV